MRPFGGAEIKAAGASKDKTDGGKYVMKNKEEVPFTPKVENRFVEDRRGINDRKDYASGAAAGGVAGGLGGAGAGGAAGAGIGALIGGIVGSVIPGPGTGLGIAIGLSIIRHKEC